MGAAEERSAVRTEVRSRPTSEGTGARGVEGAGSVKVKVWTVLAGWRVEAIISISRGKESWRGKC